MRVFKHSNRARDEILKVAVRKGDIYVIPADDLLAFNVGFLRPKIVISKGVEMLPEEERSLVLKHEYIHVRQRDNLKLLLFHLLLPDREDLEDFKAHLEIKNDSQLLKSYGEKVILRTILRFSTSSHAHATGITSSLSRRVSFLLGEKKNHQGDYTRYVLLLLLLFSIYILSAVCQVNICIE